MFWNILRHRLFHHSLCLRKKCLQPHHHGLHLCQSPLRRRRFNNLLHLTLMCNLSFHRQRLQQMMIPCRFLRLMIHHHGSIRNQRHRGFPPSTIHEDGPPPVLSFDETPFVTAPVPETPTIPSVAKRWRSRALHPVPETPTIPSVAKRWRSGRESCIERWRSDTLHPETLVPTITPPQLRWRAGVLRPMRPFRRLRDTQSDPSERVKRSRLAPAQVMSTALAKHCDCSLGFDERGPVFDGTQDWRHSIFLTGLAARKEVYFASESQENQRLLHAVMESEWKKWEEHKATLPLTQVNCAC